ncbi:hypothetical protein ASD37_23000 [Mycobacterium sp. Root135]|uniref:hypothetical protein n=1 Tax=Mycobacterium sp. Root135 TaxID=1736457 RepID=UPI0007019018|nr:hypothetical protein [Mycobacterium sp. Root135]KQY04738.1 hypothetical protein ASD37_23000 [Mycobacterium sp. Root135]
MRVLVLAAAVVTVAVTGGCTETSAGHPVAGPTSSQQAAMTTITSPATSPATTEAEMPAMGVTTTLPDTVPPNALVCLPTAAPGAPTTAQVDDASAPRIVVAMPAGWTAAPSAAGLTLTGPDGMTGAVTVAKTALDPAAAFDKYTDDVSDQAPISSISVLPAEFCGYSGQRLKGMLSGGPAGKQVYEDRIVHVWTNDGDYLIAVHVAAAEASPAFDAAAETLTADFPITLP